MLVVACQSFLAGFGLAVAVVDLVHKRGDVLTAICAVGGTYFSVMVGIRLALS